jgi:hypothetical protein
MNPVSFFPSAPNRKAARLQVSIDLEWYDQTKGQHLKEIGLAIQPSKETQQLTLPYLYLTVTVTLTVFLFYLTLHRPIYLLYLTLHRPIYLTLHRPIYPLYLANNQLTLIEAYSKLSIISF